MEEIFDNIPEQPSYDVIVIGAGAAGMMAAGTAARNGAKVLLLEKMEKPARKIRITGKGRCNLTNARGERKAVKQVCIYLFFGLSESTFARDNLALKEVIYIHFAQVGDILF